MLPRLQVRLSRTATLGKSEPMKKLRYAVVLALVGLLSLWVAACSSRSRERKPEASPTSDKDTEYLNGAVGKASEDDITANLGPPSETKELSDGSHVWVYRYDYRRTRLIFGQRTMCSELVLEFDVAKKLLQWRENRCSQGLPPRPK